MLKIIQKMICKNIIKILKIYQDSIERDRYIFKNYIDQTIFWEIHDLMRSIEKKGVILMNENEVDKDFQGEVYKIEECDE